MCKKLVFLISLVLVLSVAGSASAALVAHWKFNNEATDSLGTLNWTLVGGASYSTDAKEGSHSLMLDGTDDYAWQTAVGALANAFSTEMVMMWFKANSTNGTQVLYDEGGYTNGLSIRINNGALEAAVINGNVGFIASTPFSSTDWTHVAVTFDSGLLLLYMNGKEQDSITATFTTVASHTSGAGIGARRLDGAFGTAGTGDYFGGLIDDARLYDNALTADEIREIGGIAGGKASEPSPADGQTDVARDVVIAWKPGEFAGQHDVYFGTSFDDVNNAGKLDPIGSDNVYKARQGVNSYDVGEILDFGRTYYWRIDEVNAPPTSHVVFKGDLWSFTAEPFAYPIENITATASSSDSSSVGPENTVNSTGLDADDLHSVENHNMWLSSMTVAQPTWIQYEFDKVYQLHEMWVWNHNTTFESMLGFGLKDVSIEYSTDGADWKTLGGVPEFAQAPGADGYAHNTTVDLGGVAAKYVRLMVNSNWGGLFAQYGLSEVRFLYIPVWAREPSPASGTANVPLDAILGFRAGREAAKHDVYLSADEQAVIDGTAPVTTVTEVSYRPLSLDLGRTYYWRVDEANAAETTTTWQGEIWNFTTSDFFVVDDFEDYNNYPPDEI